MSLNKLFFGRFDRKSFAVTLFANVSCGSATVFAVITLSNLLSQTQYSKIFTVPALILFSLIYLVIIIASILIYIRRLHDLSKSGWWVLIMLIPLVNLLFLIYLLFAKGDPEINKYGERFGLKSRQIWTLMVLIIISLGVIIMLSNLPVNRLKSNKADLTLFLKDEVTDQQIEDFSRELMNTKGVRKFDFTSKEQALKIYQNARKDDPELLELVTAKMLPASIDVYLNDLSLRDKIFQMAKERQLIDKGLPEYLQ